MSDIQRHGEVRRRRSIETVSSFDELAPPYALSDPGRDRNDLNSASFQNRTRSMRYGHRVDDIIISFPQSLFFNRAGKVEITLTYTQRMDLPQPRRLIIEPIKKCIEIGNQILGILGDHVLPSNDIRSEYIQKPINAVWRLCVTFGAAICEPGIQITREVATSVSYSADELRGILERIERQLRNYEVADPGAGTADSPAFAAFAAEIVREHANYLQGCLQFMAMLNFQIYTKQFYVEDEQVAS